jgi:hypothetical protein
MKVLITIFFPLLMFSQSGQVVKKVFLKPYFGFGISTSVVKAENTNFSTIAVSSKPMYSFVYGLTVEAQYKRFVLNVGLLKLEPGIKVSLSGLYGPSEPTIDFHMAFSKSVPASIATIGYNTNVGHFFFRPEAGFVFLSRLNFVGFSTVKSGTNVSSFSIDNWARNARNTSVMLPFKFVAGWNFNFKKKELALGVELAYFYSWQRLILLDSEATIGTDAYRFTASSTGSSAIAKVFLAIPLN